MLNPGPARVLEKKICMYIIQFVRKTSSRPNLCQVFSSVWNFRAFVLVIKLDSPDAGLVTANFCVATLEFT